MNPINTPEGAAMVIQVVPGWFQLDGPAAELPPTATPIPADAQAAILRAGTDVHYRFSPAATDEDAVMVLGAGMALPIYGADMLAGFCFKVGDVPAIFSIQFFTGVGILPMPSTGIAQQ